MSYKSECSNCNKEVEVELLYDSETEENYLYLCDNCGYKEVVLNGKYCDSDMREKAK